MRFFCYLLILGSVLFATTPNYFDNLIASENTIGVTSVGHSYFLTHRHNNKVVLLIHGYTSNPEETRNIGNYLYSQGFDVFGIRMAGHGTKPEDLKTTTWQQWYSSVSDAYSELRSRYTKVYLFGVSMGAVAALKIAEETTPNGVVCAGAFLMPTSPLISFGHFIYPVSRIFGSDSIYFDAPIPKERQHITYIRNPLTSTMQLIDFQNNVPSSLSRISAPILLMQCSKDNVASPKSSQLIYGQVKASKKQLVWEGKEHSFLIDVDKKLYKQIAVWYR